MNRTDDPVRTVDPQRIASLQLPGFWPLRTAKRSRTGYETASGLSNRDANLTALKKNFPAISPARVVRQRRIRAHGEPERAAVWGPDRPRPALPAPAVHPPANCPAPRAAR